MKKVNYADKKTSIFVVTTYFVK